MMTIPPCRRTYEDRIRRVLAHIEDHLDGDLGLDALSEVACMSRFHWHRVFHAMTGETLADAVRRIRMLQAATALVREDTPIADIARRCGYANLASFSRTFRIAHGLPPGAFRERGQLASADIKHFEGGHAMYPVNIQEFPPARAAGVLHVGPYAEISRAFHTLGAALGASNLFQHAQGMIAIYHDAPGSKPESELRAHAAVVVGEDFPPALDGFEYFDLVGGRYGVLVHKGHYATLGAAWQWLYGKWLPESGEEPRDAPPIEVYVNNPQTVPVDQLLTEIRLPIA
jgi:AraC family transcriptional regulator